jgi:acetylornithine/succinyldiaminopimelate/putrescine aminotransferase
MTHPESHELWRRFINPDYVALLEAFEFGRDFVRAEGMRLFDADGRAYLDFLAGFGVHNVGHNHPHVVKALVDALSANRPSMLNIDAPRAAGQLAERLCGLTHPALNRVAFANSGAEAVDIAIKAAASGRTGPLLACEGGYHGLSVGALSLIGYEGAKHAFKAVLPQVAYVPYGDSEALREACARLRPSAFFVEPVQSEGGVFVPDPRYLVDAARICKEYECALVVDEIQTGLGRTGTLFATDFRAVVPDIVLVGKALSGGLVPVAATLMRQEVWDRAFKGPSRCMLNASTFAGGHLAMTAGLETLSVMELEQLAAQAERKGAAFMEGLKELAARHSMIADVRGRGLLLGIEFAPPKGILSKAVPTWARAGLFAQVVAAVLMRDFRIVTQPCTLAPGVLRVEPPLVVGESDMATFLHALERTLSAVSTYSTAVLTAARLRLFRR